VYGQVTGHGRPASWESATQHGNYSVGKGDSKKVHRKKGLHTFFAPHLAISMIRPNSLWLEWGWNISMETCGTTVTVQKRKLKKGQKGDRRGDSDLEWEENTARSRKNRVAWIKGAQISLRTHWDFSWKGYWSCPPIRIENSACMATDDWHPSSLWMENPAVLVRVHQFAIVIYIQLMRNRETHSRKAASRG